MHHLNAEYMGCWTQESSRGRRLYAALEAKGLKTQCSNSDSISRLSKQPHSRFTLDTANLLFTITNRVYRLARRRFELFTIKVSPETLPGEEFPWNPRKKANKF